jgi:hypothetical protein
MCLRFTLLALADVSVYRTALRTQAGFEQHPFGKVNSASGRAGLATGTVTFGAGRTYQQGG